MTRPKCSKCARLEDEVRALKARRVVACGDCRGTGQYELIERTDAGPIAVYAGCGTCAGAGHVVG